MLVRIRVTGLDGVPRVSRWIECSRPRTLSIGEALALVQLDEIKQSTKEKPMNALYLHRKADDDIDDALEYLRNHCRMMGYENITVTAGRDWYEKAFAGDWDEWAKRSGSGSRPDGKPYFDLFFVPDMQIGKATRAIIYFALMAQKPVLFWNRLDQSFQAVKGVEPNEAARGRDQKLDWRNGWILRF